MKILSVALSAALLAGCVAVPVSPYYTPSYYVPAPVYYGPPAVYYGPAIGIGVYRGGHRGGHRGGGHRGHR